MDTAPFDLSGKVAYVGSYVAAQPWGYMWNLRVYSSAYAPWQLGIGNFGQRIDNIKSGALGLSAYTKVWDTPSSHPHSLSMLSVCLYVCEV